MRPGVHTQHVTLVHRTLDAYFLYAAPGATGGASPCALSNDARRDASAAEAAEDDSERGGDGTGLPAGAQPDGVNMTIPGGIVLRLFQVVLLYDCSKWYCSDIEGNQCSN